MIARPALLRRTAATLFGGLLVVAVLQAIAFWPGIMTWDAVRQYGQALDAHYDDWHPPAMDWLWRQLLVFGKGPAPFLVVQLALYWAGFAGLVAWALRRERRGLAAALAGVAILPISLALMGAVLKDCLMAGALASAVALLAWMPARGGWWTRAPALALLIGAATLRFNALPACLPLMIALLPPAWWRTWPRAAASVIVAALVLAAAMPLANRALHAEPSGVGLSLVIFDLGGITYHSGVDVFPDLAVPHPVAANARCYSPVKWDPYSFWSPVGCPIQFEDIQDAFADPDQPENPYVHWAKAIAAHPIAYAEHRLAHFNVNTGFLLHDEIEPAAQIEAAPNPWGYGTPHNALIAAIDWLALWSGRTPLGWPICWMALAFGAAMLAPAGEARRVALPMALSSLLYGLGYLPASVASEIRYHLWTMMAAGVAAVVVASEMATAGWPPRTRLIWATAPLAIVTLLAIVWRLT